MKALKIKSSRDVTFHDVALSCLIGLCLTHDVYVSLLVLVFLFVKRTANICLYTSIVCLMFGYSTYKWHDVPTFERHDVMVVQVSEIISQDEDNVRFIGEHEQNRLYVLSEGIEQCLHVGDVLLLEGELIEVNGATVPHAFDFKSYLKSRSIYFMYDAQSLEIIESKFVWQSIRATLIDSVNVTYDETVSPYINAIFLGDDSYLNEDMMQQAQTIGVMHLFAISGLHVTLLSSILNAVLKRAQLVDQSRTVIQIIFLICFMLLSGGSASVIRAGSMLILQRLNGALKGSLSTMDCLSLVFIGHVLINPNQIVGLGFMYSYFLTYCLVGTNALHPLFISIYMMVATLPIQLVTVGEFNPLTFVANIICIPLMSVIMIPFLLLTLLFPFIDKLAVALIYSFEYILNHLQLIESFSFLVGCISRNVGFGFALLIIVSCSGYSRFKKKRAFFVPIAGGFMCIIVINLLKPPMLTMIDVGQGDSFLIQDKTCNILIDTGGVTRFGEAVSQFEYTLEPYLRGEGVSTLDYLVLTHGDFDHIGEAGAIFNHLNVKNLVVSHYGMSEALEEVITLAKEKGILVLEAKKGDILTCGAIHATVLHPFEPTKSINDGSIVLDVELNDVHMLFTGDISSEIEKQLQVGEVDILKIAHHGSVTSSDEAFIESVRPRLALISAGENNVYQHPHPTVIETIRKNQIMLYHTMGCGTVEIKLDPKTLKIRSYPKNAVSNLCQIW